MGIKIALAGNPNSGKTTLFNALTGSNQYVGNWPGVTVEKKEGKLKGNSDVIITDLPGIYSLSPYTLEEVVARKYLLMEKPDVILNIIDGTNLERNLYLTTQLIEIGIPVVLAINMMDIVKKNGDKINIQKLEKSLGCRVVEISALKGDGIKEAANVAIEMAKINSSSLNYTFSDDIEDAIDKISDIALKDVDQKRKRFYAVKLFERDQNVLDQFNFDSEIISKVEAIVCELESKLDDDSESIITNERYTYISTVIDKCYKKVSAGKLTISDKIDKIVTNRFAALPIFAVVMFLVYFISVSTVGTWATDWTNDGLFGDGYHLFGIGTSDYEDDMTSFAEENIWNENFVSILESANSAGVVGAEDLLDSVNQKDIGAFEEAYDTYGESLQEKGYAVADIVDPAMENAPDTTEYGVWVPGIPVLISNLLNSINCADWLQSLLVDGVVGGVGAVLGFVPQMLVLFIMLAFLEGCGYMARVAFVMDRIFRKFGLSGKSFIPMLIGTGCGVPGVMASRTIENERDRRMTIMTTTFIPCSAKLPIIALIASTLFGGAWWVAPVAYFIGVFAIIASGIMLKKTKMFSGEPAPFVMELPAYHWPTASNVFRSMWERGSSFMKRAGTIILLSSMLIWLGSSFGFVDGSFVFNPEIELENSLLGYIGSAISWIFAPLGFANIKATIATIMGLVAKEEVVAVFGVLDFEGMTQLAAFSFLVFNLLCAPCFAAIGAIKREMNNGKWTAFAIAYQCTFAYTISLIIYQIGSIFTGNLNVLGLIAALILLGYMGYMLFKPYHESTTLKTNVKIK